MAAIVPRGNPQILLFALGGRWYSCKNTSRSAVNTDGSAASRQQPFYLPSGLSAPSCSEAGIGGCWARQRQVCRAHRRLYHWCNGSGRQASVCFYRWRSWNTAEVKTDQIQVVTAHLHTTEHLKQYVELVQLISLIKYEQKVLKYGANKGWKPHH